MAKYRVEWVLDDVEAENTAEAAIIALNIQKGDDPPTTMFRVSDHADPAGTEPVVVVLNIVNENAPEDEAVDPDLNDFDFSDPEIPPGTTLQ